MTQQKTDATADKLSADVKALREQIEKLSEGQREIPLLRAEVIGQDKRLSDATNRIGDVSIWLSEFSIIVGILTVLIAIASLFGFRYVVIRVKDEAEEWFGKNSRRLKRKIAALEREAEDATARIQGHTRDVADVAAKSKADIEEHERRVADIIARPINDDRKLNPEEKKELRQAVEQAKDKPESQYTAHDWYLRAFDAYKSGELEKAALFWGNVEETAGASSLGIAQAIGSRGWVRYLLVDDSNFYKDTQKALELDPKMQSALCNRAFALYLKNYPRVEVLAAYEHAWQVINDAATWEELALTDLRAHGHTVRTESPPVPDDLIEAVAALAKGTE